MDRAKITLSEQEHRLMMDPSVILTKNRIIEKVYQLFGECSKACLPIFTLPPEAAVIMPKIARGEAYKALPYVMLDYPRYFTPKDVIAIRTFFWWGNYMTVTLHLKGRFILLYQRSILEQFQKLVDDGFLMAVGEDEWDHDLNNSGYISLKGISIENLEEQMLKGSFFKLTRSYPLEKWDELPDQLLNTYELLGEVIRLRGE